jgi:hypothetical protein
VQAAFPGETFATAKFFRSAGFDTGFIAHGGLCTVRRRSEG